MKVMRGKVKVKVEIFTYGRSAKFVCYNSVYGEIGQAVVHGALNVPRITLQAMPASYPEEIGLFAMRMAVYQKMLEFVRVWNLETGEDWSRTPGCVQYEEEIKW